MPTLVSVNVGPPREVTWRGRRVTTGIFKEAVEGPVRLRRHNLDGDRQADLSVHGGPTKAVYAYPSEHYAYWREELGEPDLAWGAFGENFTTEGLVEESVHIGDEFRVGSARVVITEPRMPCYKLGVRFRRADMVKRFLASRRTGFYLGVVDQGVVEAGDTLERLREHPAGVRVADVTGLRVDARVDRDMLRKAAELEALPEGWRNRFRAALDG